MNWLLWLVGATIAAVALSAPAETQLDELCIKAAARHSTTPERACQKL